MNDSVPSPAEEQPPLARSDDGSEVAQKEDTVPEIGGRRNGLDPTRYGDWEKNGRCIDF